MAERSSVQQLWVLWRILIHAIQLFCKPTYRPSEDDEAEGSYAWDEATIVAELDLSRTVRANAGPAAAAARDE